VSAILTSTPIIFIIFVLLTALFSYATGREADKTPGGEHELEAYACGQRNISHFVSPNYERVFKYAFFFTVMHVLVLVTATAPHGLSLMPIIYVTSGLVSILILFKRFPE